MSIEIKEPSKRPHDKFEGKCLCGAKIACERRDLHAYSVYSAPSINGTVNCPECRSVVSMWSVNCDYRPGARFRFGL